MNKTVSIIITIALIIGIGIIFIGNSNSKTIAVSLQNSEIKDGIQYITINARGGYSPRISSAKADIPTKLIVNTNNTYDCSAALSIKSLNYRKILPQTGNTEIDIGIPKANEPLRGVCAMGMYSFVVNFE